MSANIYNTLPSHGYPGHACNEQCITVRGRKEKRITFSKKKRLEILAKTEGRCGYCGEKLEKFQVDHIQPIHSLAGTNADENLIAACAQCNSFKGGNPLKVFRSELGYQLERAIKYSVNYRMAKKFKMVHEWPSRNIVFFFEKKKCRTCNGIGNCGIPTQGDYITPDPCGFCNGTGRC